GVRRLLGSAAAGLHHYRVGHGLAGLLVIPHVNRVAGRQISDRDVLATLADLSLRADREGPLRVLALGLAADHERIGSRRLDRAVGVAGRGLLHVGGRLLRRLLCLGSSWSGLAL